MAGINFATVIVGVSQGLTATAAHQRSLIAQGQAAHSVNSVFAQ